MTQNTRSRGNPLKMTLIILLSLATTVVILIGILPFIGSCQPSTARVSIPKLSEKFDEMFPSIEEIAAPFEGSQETQALVRKVRKLNDSDIIAPAPNPDGYHEVNSTSELEQFIKDTAVLLDDQSLYFSKDRDFLPGAPIQYYLDESIAVVTWKEPLDTVVLTFAEVKIADGSQFRRFLADGEFGAETQYHTTDMAKTVNAVVASSGDFYKFRYNGVVVYEGTVRRVNTNKADTCYINDEGDLIFSYQNTTMTTSEAQQFVDDNGIRFSLTFGPVLVDDGARCEPQNYDLGEVNSFSPRAALCQMGKLHYLIVTSNSEDGYPGALNIHQFAQRLSQTGCQKAYALDGGQTAAIALDGKLVNHVLYGQQRPISDIIYFATSVDNGG